MKKFFVYATNSCLERILDCQKIHNYLLANGWQPVRKISAADLIIVSTCALTTGEDRSSVEYVRRCLNKKSPEAKIVIAGCLPVLMPDMLRSLGDFPIVPPTDLSAFDPLINPVVRFNDVAEPNDVKVSSFHNLLLKQWLAGKSAVTRLLGGNVFRPAFWRQCSSALRKNIDFLTSLQSRIDPFLVGKRDSLFYIRISRGCLGACSYCAKRHATGKLQSKPAGAVLAEFKAGLAAGRRYFFLVTEDAGCYGMDIGTTIVDLLREIFAAGKHADFKIVISNFNARWLVRFAEELTGILAADRDKIYYFQVPVQSGSNRILEAMNRQYRIEDVERCLKMLRGAVPALNLTTDIIAGFPGETEDDFKQTKDFLGKINFNHVEVFEFQDRPNTPAHCMPGKIPGECSRWRAGELVRGRTAPTASDTIGKKIIEVIRDHY